MKKVIAVVLIAALILSMISVSVSASDVSATVSGRKTDTEAVFYVDVENIGDTSDEIFVYIAYFDSSSIFKEMEKISVEVAAQSSDRLTYLRELDGGSIRIHVWDTGMIPLCSLSTAECEEVDELKGDLIEITTDDVWASNLNYASASNVVDNSTSTKWSAAAEGDAVTLYLGGDYLVCNVSVDFDSSNTTYTVFVSDDGENFTAVTEETATSEESVDISNIRARYVRIVTGGAVGINEIDVYGYEDNTGEMLMEKGEAEDWIFSAMDEMTYTTDYRPALGNLLYGENGEDGLVLYDAVDRSGVTTGDEYTITAVTASQEPESANAAANAIDNDTSTIWTASGVTDDAPATLVVDLGEEKSVGAVGLVFGNGSSRTYTYSVSASNDNSSYTEVIAKTTAKSTDDLQIAYFDAVSARYVKFTFYARTDSSNNGWIRVGEVKAYDGDIEGAGGILAQKSLDLPNDRGDYAISFDINVPSTIDGSETSAFYSGISLTDGIITGGGDLDNYSAVQLKLDNNNGKLAVKRITSNYFNEIGPVDLFENTFNKDEKVHFELVVSPTDRTCFVTVSDSEVSETQLVHFNYADSELTRNSSWTWLEANTLVFNTGAGAKTQMTITDINLRSVEREDNTLTGVDPVNGIVRLEATRLDTYPTTSGDYYGRYVYHNGADNMLAVHADINPAKTRFVERRGLIGTGVSFESVLNPGYFVVCEMGDGYYLEKLENTGSFYAKATFYKEEAENVGYYTGSTYTYRAYLQGANSNADAMEDKYLYDTTSDYITGDVKPWKMWTAAQATFYLRSEGTAYASDNFYGNSIGSQWWTNYPWKSNNPTNDSYNYSALITKNNVIVENGELLLKATEIASNAWPTDTSGETGKQYNGDFGRTDWVKWKGYVGVVSIQDKVYNKQCYLEGSFKQPESPIGYWNAFWLTGRDSWPPEIDIFETLSSVYGHYAWHTAIHGEGDTNNLFGKQTSSINVATDYHTFALDWGYDYVKFYVDGTLFQRGHNHDTIDFQKNLRLILNTGIGGWESEPDDTMVWNDGLRCQWIRTFQY